MALGGKYKDSFIGSCKYSDLAVFSFHPVKMITTGEGGAVSTNDRNIADKCKLLRTQWYYKEKEYLKFNDNYGGIVLYKLEQLELVI